MYQPRHLAIALVPLSLLLPACGAEDAPDVEQEWLDEYGVQGPFEAGEQTGKEDGPGAPGPKVAWDTGTSAVWSVEHQWADVTPEAGPAWNADSGLDWNEKFAAWLESMEVVDAVTGWGDARTFELTTPWGKELPAPVLECAEVAIFLRATFSAWHGLPFYMEAWSDRQPLYLGHFGFLRGDGTRFGNAPRFASAYADHRSSWSPGSAWPQDAKLRGRGLYGGGDEHPFLDEVGGKPAQAGAYFDEIYLNKRVGHFMLLVLSWFGSIHLADPANMFHLQPEATRAGDVLLERWQRKGIGHTIPVMRVTELGAERLEIAVATGSMPRRQPVWEEGPQARHYFTMEETGGEGETYDGERYAQLGGGIRRWRVAVPSGGRYRNTFLDEDQTVWVNSRDLDDIAARPARFAELLKELTKEEKRDIALEQIANARGHLSTYPASCAARTRREAAFAELYAVMEAEFGTDRATVDAEHRTLEDYVFAELVYEQSKTCCWNHSTTAMHDLVMAYNTALQEKAEEQGVCQQPVVFMARDASATDDGYGLWRDYAQAQGRGGDWVAWTEDEPCAWADGLAMDTEAEHAGTPWCELPSE